MRVAVLGAGVIGVTTAYELLRDGHQVTVIDRENEPASGASHANAGLVAPGHAYAWASPAAPRLMLRSLLNADAAIRFRPRADPRQWRWVAAFLRQCTGERALINTRNKARLCVYSQERLAAVAAETGVRFDRNTGGLMYFYRSPETFERAAAKCAILRDAGIEIEVLDRAAVIAKDPGLAGAAEAIAGALFAPTDESGDACHFTRALAKHCAANGVRFEMGVSASRFATEGERVTDLVTTVGHINADAYVVCLGLASPELLKSLRLSLPIYPVKGYSVTLPAASDRKSMPRFGGVDEDHLLAYCPMGGRLRLTATAEIGGYDASYRPSDFTVLLSRARALFPDAADFSKPTYWAGLRPMTPTGMPAIDRTRFANLFLNTGHGHIGWTMSCGSARIVADLVAGRRPAIARDGQRTEDHVR